MLQSGHNLGFNVNLHTVNIYEHNALFWCHTQCTFDKCTLPVGARCVGTKSVAQSEGHDEDHQHADEPHNRCDGDVLPRGTTQVGCISCVFLY